MNAITIGQVLVALCRHCNIDRNFNRTIDYKTFTDAMLGSGLMLSRTSVKTKWIQISNTPDLIIQTGTKGQKGTEYVALDTYWIERIILKEGLRLPPDWEGKVDTHTTHTQMEGVIQ